MEKIRIAITHGDTNGKGYEILFKAFETQDSIDFFTPIIYGSPKIASYHRKYLNSQTNFTIIQKAEEAQNARLNLLATFDDEVRVTVGEPTQESARAALRAVNRALDDYKSKLYDVLVTMPVELALMHEIDSAYTASADYIAKHLDEPKASRLYVGENMKMMVVSEAKRLEDVCKEITKETLTNKLQILHKALKSDFRISNPRIAVLALNPTQGKEEEEIIKPVVEEMTESGLQCFGPYTADEVFGGRLYEEFDAVLAMYHDQAVPQFLLLNENRALMTVGMDMIHCSYLDEREMSSPLYPLYVALDAFRNRNNYDEAHSNPLPKLYHEHKEGEERRPRFLPLDFLKEN